MHQILESPIPRLCILEASKKISRRQESRIGMMKRRDLLKAAGVAGLFELSMPRDAAAQAQTERATRGMPAPRIRDISVIETQPAGVRLTVVKVTTDQDRLLGYGCATVTQRAD